MTTPQYIKNAQNAYNARFDLVQLKLPKGTKGRIKAILEDGQSITGYCVESVLVALENDEGLKGISKSIAERAQTMQTGPIRTGKEEHEAISKERVKPQNKAEKEPIDLQALQAELDAKRAEEQRRQAEKEAEKV